MWKHGLHAHEIMLHSSSRRGIHTHLRGSGIPIVLVLGGSILVVENELWLFDPPTLSSRRRRGPSGTASTDVGFRGGLDRC